MAPPFVAILPVILPPVIVSLPYSATYTAPPFVAVLPVTFMPLNVTSASAPMVKPPPYVVSCEREIVPALST